ncbi:MAG: class II aldolase/adducin family protein [Candidatus Lokiarchaeota archaeon]|nr:class II aldolase/adducin family protein [Candidatus Lokiarchaeota archaeon]
MGKYDEYKKIVLNACKKMVNLGYVVAGGSGGNISVRIEGEEAVAVSPSNKDYLTLEQDDICIVDYDLQRIDAKYNPSVETKMHNAVYKTRLDVNAIVHTHQPYASIFSIINEPIPALFDEQVVNIGDVIEIIPYAMSGSVELLEKVVSKIDNNCNAFIIQNHGVLGLGINIDAAFRSVGLMEKVARVYYYALTLNKPISKLPEKETKAFFKFLKSEQRSEIRKKKKDTNKNE